MAVVTILMRVVVCFGQYATVPRLGAPKKLAPNQAGVLTPHDWRLARACPKTSVSRDFVGNFVANLIGIGTFRQSLRLSFPEKWLLGQAVAYACGAGARSILETSAQSLRTIP